MQPSSHASVRRASLARGPGGRGKQRRGMGPTDGCQPRRGQATEVVREAGEEVAGVVAPLAERRGGRTSAWKRPLISKRWWPQTMA